MTTEQRLFEIRHRSYTAKRHADDLSPAWSSYVSDVSFLLAELDAARARERHALVAGAEALRRIAAATPIGHEDVTKGPSTYSWLCYAASLLMDEAATMPATPLEQELITMRAREAKLRESLAQIAHGGPLEGQRVASPMKMYQAQAVARAALAEGEDTRG